ncbi:MAG: hypothetical protein ACJAUP_000572 [Cellvibrionaceae bacterium]
MTSRLNTIWQTIKTHYWKCILFSIAFTVFYYALLMLSLIVRFQDLPNYINTYDWLENLKTIVISTPSLKDTLLIMKGEWVMEIGFMNYDYGAGISEWSLFLAPVKMLGVFTLGALLTINYFVFKKNTRCYSLLRRRSSSVTAGFGAAFVSLASITMSWVVCCSTPTWVVGLAMMGLGVSTSLWLEPLGLLVSLIGFVLLIIALFIAAGRSEQRSEFL